MAYETGTATSHQDLYDKLIAFLTTNTDLVAEGQNWTQVWTAPVGAENETDTVLMGPGLSGTDAIYVALRLDSDVGADAYWIETRGATGFLANAEEYDGHVNPMPKAVRTFLDSGTMTYWFTASGRRFIVVVKISTTFEALYAGWFLPYATPLEYPYPMFIGGSAGPVDTDGPVNWRTINSNHTQFIDPYYNSGADYIEPSAWMMDPAGTWLRVGGSTGSETQVGILPPRSGGDYFFGSDSNDASYSLHPDFVLERMMSAYGGSRALIPCTLVEYLHTSQTYGILDGAYRCQGYSNAAENQILIDTHNYLVVPNVYRSNFGDYWAAFLE
jgi:hypothetical protein